MSDRSRDWPARLELDPTVFIAPGAVVVGEVTIGSRSSVWFNTVVRGDADRIEVGADTNLQDNSTIHVDEGFPARIGSRVTVGHRAIIHGCEIADDCLIGMGSIVLSGARIGAGCLIGAGALVREGQVIAEGSLAVGAPARVIGPVSEAHRASIRSGSEHYVALSRSYLARGFARPHPAVGSAAGATCRESGPMTFLEWERLNATLEQGPRWVAVRLKLASAPLWRARPKPGRWSALEVMCHLRDADQDVYLPRLDAMLVSDPVAVNDVVMIEWDAQRHYLDQDPGQVLADWRAARARLVARLAPLGRRDWARVGIHSVRGPFPLSEMVRGWVDHDLSHRRQIAEALGEFAG
ncbi:MAG: DinB family protein [Candidatus Eisenbacteria bacterium]|nr:DinB family protein [Candidatus Eisenbacteria bacterium]